MTVINIQWLNSRVSQWVEKIQDAAFLFSYPYVSKYAFTKRFGTLESKIDTIRICLNNIFDHIATD